MSRWGAASRIQNPLSPLPSPRARWLPWPVALLLCFALLIRPAGAQDSGPVRIVNLPSEGVTALHAAPDGLWIGTLAGLARWDGQRVSAVELPLDEPHVTALLGNGAELWVGTVDGLARWDGQRWQQWQRGAEGLASGWIRALALHEERPLVGSYGGGVQRWDGGRWRALGDGGPRQITALASDGELLWAGTPRALWRWEDRRWTRERDGPVLDLLAADGLWLAGEDRLWRRDASGTWSSVLEEGVSALAPSNGGVTVATRSGALLALSHGAPPEPLPFPTGLVSALAPAERGVAAGYLGQGLWLANEGAAPTAERLPVVLVAGLGERRPVERTNLRFLAEWLAADGYDVTLAPVDSAHSLVANIQRLHTHIGAQRERSGAPHVWLIGHSWGGLVASAYLATAPGTVAGLMTLGTPHAGLRLAYPQLVSKLDELEPGALALLPEHQALLAPYLDTTTAQRHVGGTLLPQGALFRGYPPHDGLISAGSATAAPGERRTAPLLHGWTVQSLSLGAESFLWPDSFYHTTIRPWLQPERPLPVAEDVALDVPPAGHTERLLWEGTLAPGERLPLRVPLSAAPTTWFLDGEGIEMALRAPDGTRFEGEEPFLGERLARLPWIDGLAEPLGLWATDGEGGMWEAELHNPGVTAQPTRLTLVTPSENPILPILPEWSSPDEPFTLWVRAPPGQRLDATVAAADAVPLAELLPGLYGTRLSAPAQPGYHALRVRMGSRQRWAVLGVRHPAPDGLQAHSVEQDEGITLRLSGLPKGLDASAGVELLGGGRVVGAALLGPFAGPEVALHLPDALGPAEALRWQLFATDPALVPIGDSQTIPIENPS